ncbi:MULTISPECIES: TonB-dependent receptor [unclassified Aureimonas]|uniref:TonB-dependent receptor n=1 Tax=unclassified Aureimonas TaxID=2615206 RepID=UPI0006FAFAAC|nr:MULTISPECIES: TonB-dependent receptor [unclassified Aureimonas]KQT60722.1 hypothetical protein ASG54_25055 [Aureimonas sp. Leaf460]KQT68851.1 hypothetical protein ASG62_18575 [Aureimonas sp. Leaf427]
MTDDHTGRGALGRWRRRHLWLAGVLAASTALGGPGLTGMPAASAEEAGGPSAPVAFAIPAQPLAAAIDAFARASGWQVSYSSEAARGRTSQAVNGTMAPEAALRQIVAGSGIALRVGAPGSAALVAETSGAVAAGAPAADGSTMIDVISVEGKGDRLATTGSGFQGTPDWVYRSPTSTSVVSREAIEANPATRSAADTLDTVAGVMTNRSEAQNPGIAVMVRGLQDQNRVTTSIDGARQNFQRAGHGSYQRAYVDTAFVRAVEVEKGAVTGVGGAGSLGGAVNFRTLMADDLIEPGRRFGMELEGGTGTNAFKSDGSAVAAVRLSDDFSLLAGIGGKKIGDYEIGQHGDFKYANVAQGITIVDDKTLFSRSDVMNSLLKAEGNLTDDLSFDASWLHYEATAAQGGYPGGVLRRDDEDFTNDTVTTSLTYDPASELIDAKARFWFNDISNDEIRGYDNPLPVSYGMQSLGGSLENTSRVTLPFGDLALHYGGEAFQDDGDTTTTDQKLPNGADLAYGFSGPNPAGKRTMASGFANATLEHGDWLTLTGGLRYDHFNLKGSTLVQAQGIIPAVAGACLEWEDIDGDGTPDPNGLWMDEILWVAVPGPGPNISFEAAGCRRSSPGTDAVPFEAQYPVNVDQSGGAWLPSATVAVKPFDWLQPFVSYSRTYRPPAVTESLISGGHPGVPYENAPNPDLKAEEGETWEFGVNISRDALITAEDYFRVKAVYFDRRIEDYITLGYTWFQPANKLLTSFVNLDGETSMRGFELEASYDLGYAYVGGAYTRMDTDWANSYTLVAPGEWAQTGTSPRPAVLFEAPEDKLTVDAGLRLFDRRLVLGARGTYVSDTLPKFGQLLQTVDSYKVYDLYGSFEFTKQAKLRVGVSNVADEAYVPSLGSASYPAPGRTYTAAMKLKF